MGKSKSIRWKPYGAVFTTTDFFKLKLKIKTAAKDLKNPYL
jgi:hypothetical protein